MRVFIGISGASGALYGLRVLRAALELGALVDFCASVDGEEVVLRETGLSLADHLARIRSGNLVEHANDDLGAGPASGSTRIDAYIVAPCSMASLAEIAYGGGRRLITRAAQVALKEGRRLVLAPRESPLSLPQLRAMCAAAEAGAIIAPAMPSFYHRPEGIDELIDDFAGRLLAAAGMPNGLVHEWDARRDQRGSNPRPTA